MKGQLPSQSLSLGLSDVSGFTWPARSLECASCRKIRIPRFSTFSAIDKIRPLSNSTTRRRISGSACVDDFSVSPTVSTTFRGFRIEFLPFLATARSICNTPSRPSRSFGVKPRLRATRRMAPAGSCCSKHTAEAVSAPELDVEQMRANESRNFCLSCCPPKMLLSGSSSSEILVGSPRTGSIKLSNADCTTNRLRTAPPI